MGSSSANTGLAALGGLLLLLAALFFVVVSVAFAFGAIHQGALYGWTTVGLIAVSILSKIAAKL